jgi:hypothetical protein
VWVMAGVHKPTTTSDRAISFVMKSGVEVYGGFAGSEAALDQRDWTSHVTILSGDIDSNDINEDGNFIAESVDDLRNNNSYHVVFANEVDAAAVLDGFVITAGSADGATEFKYDSGGGMYNLKSHPQLKNLTFSGNLATLAGGGLRNWDGSPTLNQVIFYHNKANYGGGMYNVRIEAASYPTLTQVSFVGNWSNVWGGGMLNDDNSPSLTNVVFSGNHSELNGGGLLNYNHSSPVLTNATFSANSASFSGGAMMNDVWSHPILKNSILWGNSANAGSQIYNGTHYNFNTPIISYCIIEGSGGSGAGWNTLLGTDSGNNLDADPLLVDADGADNIPGTLDDDLRLQTGSPAIDTGNDAALPGGVTTDMDGNSRILGAHVDIGAYEALLRVFLPAIMGY